MSSPQARPIHSGPLPSPEEAAALLKNQAVYTSHLESESRYIKVFNHCMIEYISLCDKYIIIVASLFAFDHTDGLMVSKELIK